MVGICHVLYYIFDAMVAHARSKITSILTSKLHMCVWSGIYPCGLVTTLRKWMNLRFDINEA